MPPNNEGRFVVLCFGTVFDCGLVFKMPNGLFPCDWGWFIICPSGFVSDPTGLFGIGPPWVFVSVPMTGLFDRSPRPKGTNWFNLPNRSLHRGCVTESKALPQSPSWQTLKSYKNYIKYNIIDTLVYDSTINIY